MRIDASSLLSLKPELADLLKNLEVGDTLKGRVLEVLENMISVKTASGQVYTAVLMDDAQIPKGASIELLINSITDGKIYAELKPESRSIDVDAKVSELLMNYNLPVDEKNIDAVKLLIKYKLPLSKEVITNITGLQKSIESLNESAEGRAGLLLSGLDINNTPVDVLNKAVMNWPKQMANIEPEQPVLQEAGKNSPEASASQAEDSKAVKPETAKENREPVKEANTNANLGVERDIKAQKSDSIELIQSKAAESTDVGNNKAEELVRVLNKLGIGAGEDIKSFVGQVVNILSDIRNTDMEALVYLASKGMKATPKNLGQLMKNIENSDGISQFLDKLEKKTAVEDNPELKKLNESIKKVFLEPRRVEDAKEVADQLKDIAKLGEELEKYLSGNDNKDPEIRETLSNLRDNIDFIKNINQNNNYLQLPVLINGDTSTAKLYVFKEGKKSREINPESATILVALDLRSLGHLESLVGVNGKTVNVTFRVENKSIGSLIEKQSFMLKDSLREKGYSLSPVRVIRLEQSFNLLSLEELINESNIEKIHFDMRI